MNLKKWMKTWKLQSQCWKTHLQKLRSFSLFLDRQKKHHHQNTFFCSFRWDGLFPSFFLFGIKIMGFPNRCWPQTTGKNKGAQPATPQPGNQWIGAAWPRTCKSNKANSTSGAGARGWWKNHPFKKSSMVATFSDLPLQSVLQIMAFLAPIFLFFPSMWGFWCFLCS